MHMVQTNGWNQPDHSPREIAAGNGLRPEMVNRRWLTGDGSRETDDDRSPCYMKILRICEVIPFSRSRL